jgi:hypothetical protein
VDRREERVEREYRMLEIVERSPGGRVTYTTGSSATGGRSGSSSSEPGAGSSMTDWIVAELGGLRAEARAAYVEFVAGSTFLTGVPRTM